MAEPVKSDFFKGLSRLFSTGVIVRLVGGKKLKVLDTDRLQGFSREATNILYDKFTRLYSTRTVGYGNDQYVGTYPFLVSRYSLYSDYELMDADPTVATALDIFADESCLRNEYGDMLEIKSADQNIKTILHNLFYDILNIEFNLWPWTRNLVKYGDFIMKLDMAEKFGIVNVIPLSIYEVGRDEGFNPKNPYDVRFIHRGMGGAEATYNSYEIAHFRLLSDTNYFPYGKSIIESGRKIWKQLTLMEDAMLIHRIMRAPERRIFKIDIGSIPPNEVDAYMQNIINSMKKVPFMDEQTGDYNLRFNLMNMLEDYYVPVRGDKSGTDIGTLPGMQFNGMDDIKYLMYRFLSSIRMPNAFLGFEEYIEGKATLASLDVRFARTVERIQNTILEQLYKIAVIHLYAQGFRDKNLINFTLHLTTPSVVYENEKIALWSEKIRIAKDFKDSKLFGDEWIYKNIFGLSDDQITTELKSVVEATKRTFRYTQIETEGNDPAITKESFGTPHDLAAMYVKQKYNVNNPYNEDGSIYFGEPAFDQYTGFLNKYKHNTLDSRINPPKGTNLGGRPPESLKYKTDKHPMGRNPLGQKDLEDTFNVDLSPKHNFRDNSPFAYMEGVKQRIKNMIEAEKYTERKKKVLTETYKEEDSSLTTKGTYMDEDNLLEDKDVEK